MTIVNRVQTVKFLDSTPKALGGSRIIVGSVTVDPPLTENVDYSVDYALGTVLRSDGLSDVAYTFSFQHDDRSEELKDADAESELTDFRSKFLGAIATLDTIQTQVLNVPNTFTNNTNRDKAIKDSATAIGNLANILEQTLQFLRAQSGK